MKAERLAKIKRDAERHDSITFAATLIRIDELIEYVDELTRQLDDARDKAINAGIFTSTDGDESKYTHALNTGTCEGCGHPINRDGYCYRCETETSTPGATSYKP